MGEVVMAVPIMNANGVVPPPKIEVTVAVVSIRVNAGGKGIRLDVSGDLSNVAWRIEGCDETFRIPANSFLQLNFEVVEDNHGGRLGNLREGMEELIVKKKTRAVGRKKK